MTLFWLGFISGALLGLLEWAHEVLYAESYYAYYQQTTNAY